MYGLENYWEQGEEQSDFINVTKSTKIRLRSKTQKVILDMF